MRPLVALGIFRETDAQTYTSTPISEVLTAPPLIGGYQFMCVRKTILGLSLTEWSIQVCGRRSFLG